MMMETDNTLRFTTTPCALSPDARIVKLSAWGIVEAEGTPYHGMPLWALFYHSLGYSHLMQTNRPPLGPGQCMRLDVAPEYREGLGLHPSVETVEVGKRDDGSLYAVEIVGEEDDET